MVSWRCVHLSVLVRKKVFAMHSCGIADDARQLSQMNPSTGTLFFPLRLLSYPIGQIGKTSDSRARIERIRVYQYRLFLPKADERDPTLWFASGSPSDWKRIVEEGLTQPLQLGVMFQVRHVVMRQTPSSAWGRAKKKRNSFVQSSWDQPECSSGMDWMRKKERLSLHTTQPSDYLLGKTCKGKPRCIPLIPSIQACAALPSQLTLVWIIKRFSSGNTVCFLVALFHAALKQAVSLSACVDLYAPHRNIEPIINLQGQA